MAKRSTADASRPHADSVGGLNAAADASNETGGGVDPREHHWAEAVRTIAQATGASIHEKLRAVRLDVGYVGKDKRNKGIGGGFNFRGIDDALNHVGPVLVRYGVTIGIETSDLQLTREVVELPADDRGNVRERVESHATVKMRVTFSCESPENVRSSDDYFVSQTMFGEGMDYGGDKAINKAMAAAFKYALFLGLCLPVSPESLDDSDNDDRQQERGQSRAVNGQQQRRSGGSPDPQSGNRGNFLGVCPACGVAAVIQGKEEFGGGYVCWKGKQGCGAKFAQWPPIAPDLDPPREQVSNVGQAASAPQSDGGPTAADTRPTLDTASPADESRAAAKAKFWKYCQSLDKEFPWDVAGDIWSKLGSIPSRAAFQAYCVFNRIDDDAIGAAWEQYGGNFKKCVAAIEQYIAAASSFGEESQTAETTVGDIKSRA